MWFWLVIFAYVLNAIATLISKWLLAASIPHPVVFVFYIGVLNLLALVLIPFGFFVPPMAHIIIALVSGATYAAAMYYLAKALHIDQVSQVAPMVGGLQPIFVVAFAWFFLPEGLNIFQYFGILLLIIGSLLMALEIGKKSMFISRILEIMISKEFWIRFFYKIIRRQEKAKGLEKHGLFTASIKYILISSVLFGFSYALLKLVYLQQNFASGFVWTRFGTFLFVLVLVLLPKNWQHIKQNFIKSGEQVKVLFVVGQILGALSFLLVSYAIFLGPVTVINALQGVQYALLFIIILVLARKYPRLLDEPLTRPVIIQKIIAILIIISGLVLVI
jgi:drug/metabolite transporter (DMT)-like permease